MNFWLKFLKQPSPRGINLKNLSLIGPNQRLAMWYVDGIKHIHAAFQGQSLCVDLSIFF